MYILPIEVLESIFFESDLRDLRRIQQICKTWKAIIDASPSRQQSSSFVQRKVDYIQPSTAGLTPDLFCLVDKPRSGYEWTHFRNHGHNSLPIGLVTTAAGTLSYGPTPPGDECSRSSRPPSLIKLRFGNGDTSSAPGSKNGQNRLQVSASSNARHPDGILVRYHRF